MMSSSRLTIVSSPKILAWICAQLLDIMSKETKKVAEEGSMEPNNRAGGKVSFYARHPWVVQAHHATGSVVRRVSEGCCMQINDRDSVKSALVPS